jgi:dihydrodipicolinate synthase/N-acetylneuraminate lyase
MTVRLTPCAGRLVASPSIGAMSVTPFDVHDRVDDEALSSLVDHIASAGVTVYLGSYGSGEGHLLRADEIDHLYEIGAAAAAGRAPVVASALGFAATDSVIGDATRATKHGVDAVQIHPPRPGPTAIRPRIAELERYYEDVLNAVTTPIFLTTQTVMVGYQVPIGLVSDLVSHYDQIVAVNCSDPDPRYLASIIESCRLTVPVYTGMLAQLPLALALGGAGSLCFEADIAPKLCMEICRSAFAGDAQTMHAMFGRAWKLNDILSKFQNPRSVKAALTAAGLPGGYLRRPYLPLEDMEVDEITQVLTTSGIVAYEGLTDYH